MTGTVRRASERREAIHRFVAAHRGHPTAEQILQGVRRGIPGIGLATIYRNLDVLVADGRLSRTVHEGVARYEARTDPHPHFRCERCGAVTDVDLDVAPLLRAAARRTGGEISAVEVEVRGVCARCRE
ncbi:MAG: Fur family transcriptional regulator [Thermoanaerobaculia bacterium]